MTSSSTIEAIAQRQLEAYNACDVEALIQIYADDAELYSHPSTLLAKGSDALRERFATRFLEPNLNARLLNRMIMGNMVIDHERIARNFPEGPGTLEMVMIYEIKGERITRAWAMSGMKTFDAKPLT